MPFAQPGQTHSPYLKQIASVGSIGVWLMDGAIIRRDHDIDFTNFGQAPWYDLPPDEMWIDDVNGLVPNEWVFYLENMIAQRQALQDGQSKEEARQTGNRIELELRWQQGGHAVHKPLPADYLQSVVQLKQLGQDPNGVPVWLVSGRDVRDLSGYVDWVEGGNDMRYRFQPKPSIWVDDQTCQKEWPFFIRHESHERDKMAHGMAYGPAHKDANRIELDMRRAIDDGEYQRWLRYFKIKTAPFLGDAPRQMTSQIQTPTPSSVRR